MISVLHCKFLKIFEFTKSDKTKGFRLRVLDENENDITSYSFFISNELAMNCKNIAKLQDVAISFDIWFSPDGTIRYRIKNIVVEK